MRIFVFWFDYEGQGKRLCTLQCLSRERVGWQSVCACVRRASLQRPQPSGHGSDVSEETQRVETVMEALEMEEEQVK